MRNLALIAVSTLSVGSTSKVVISPLLNPMNTSRSGSIRARGVVAQPCRRTPAASSVGKCKKATCTCTSARATPSGGASPRLSGMYPSRSSCARAASVAASGGGGTVTISTYVFALIAVGACVVGSVFSFVIGKVIDTIKSG